MHKVIRNWKLVFNTKIYTWERETEGKVKSQGHWKADILVEGMVLECFKLENPSLTKKKIDKYLFLKSWRDADMNFCLWYWHTFTHSTFIKNKRGGVEHCLNLRGELLHCIHNLHSATSGCVNSDNWFNLSVLLIPRRNNISVQLIDLMLSVLKGAQFFHIVNIRAWYQYSKINKHENIIHFQLHFFWSRYSKQKN